MEFLRRLKLGEDIRDEKQNVIYRADEYALPQLPSRSYAYCSDTQPSEQVIQMIQGADLVYHEATFLEEDKEKARETKHSTAAEAARVAERAGVKKLIIGHFSARYKDLNLLLSEARAIFPHTALALEGESFEITGS